MPSPKIYAFTCGAITFSYPGLRSTETGMLKVPVTSYLVDHPKGHLVFDTGMSLQIRNSFDDYVPEYAKHDRSFHYEAGDDIASRLTGAGFDTDDISMIVNSHLHHDHCGGNALIPNARVLVQQVEWDHAQRQGSDTMAYRRADFETGQEVQKLEGDHDVFGDGSVMCLPTPGHTPGHQSLRVTTSSGTYLLCGDACYLSASLDDLVLPLNVADPTETRETLEKLQAMRDEGIQVFPGHDPWFWKNVPQAPERVA